MPVTRILLIDDHAMFRTGLAVLLRMGIADLEVAEAESMAQALHAEHSAPDLVLLDILLHGLNGLEGIDLIKRKWPHAPVVMVSSDAAPETVRQAMARGATAFVSKATTADGILELVKKLIAHTPSDSVHPHGGAGADGDVARLTPRQLEVLDLLCLGLPNKAIGRRLDLSENTVRWHVQGILSFLQVASRSEAAFAARNKGLVG